jgi:hypothetical protein
MGPDVRFLKNPHPSNVGIEVYKHEVVRNNLEGTFVSHSTEGDLPDGERGYANPTLPTTLISGPQVVFQHPKQDVVLSERHGCFMQPTGTSCPTCHPNDKRINFNGGPAGFTLEIFPEVAGGSQKRKRSAYHYCSVWLRPRSWYWTIISDYLKGGPKPPVRKFGRKTISVITAGANGNFGHTGPGLSWEVGWGRGGR